jgi:hypothetical protein
VLNLVQKHEIAGCLQDRVDRELELPAQ